MDKLEKLIEKNLVGAENGPPLDVEAILSGTHRKIKQRARRRKAVYASPVLVLLIMLVYVFLPDNGFEQITPGGELLITGWEQPWTSATSMELEVVADQELYEQTLDYLIDEQFTVYSNDVNELLDEDDLEDLIRFLREV